MNKEDIKNNLENFEEVAELLKIIAHPIRLCIICGLSEVNCCNVTYMQNCLDIPQSTLSQHLQKLRAAKIIKGERNGLEINYKLIDKRVSSLVKLLVKDNIESK